MSRSALSQFFAVNAVGDATARLMAVQGATVVVKKRSDDSLVTVYDAETGGAPIATILTDNAGRPPGYVDRPGEYKAEISKPPEIDAYTFEFDVEYTAGDVQLIEQKDQPGGYLGLDGAGLVPASKLPVSALEYKGAWNASTNTPGLADGTGNTGDEYRVSTDATRDLGSGVIKWKIGDYVIYNGATWEQITRTLSAEERLALAMIPDSLIAGTITRDVNEAVTAADVVWPDGTTGVFTGTPSSSSFGAVDSYAITYGARTYTQPTVTRDAAGAVTVRPAIVVT